MWNVTLFPVHTLLSSILLSWRFLCFLVFMITCLPLDVLLVISWTSPVSGHILTHLTVLKLLGLWAMLWTFNSQTKLNLLWEKVSAKWWKFQNVQSFNKLTISEFPVNAVSLANFFSDLQYNNSNWIIWSLIVKMITMKLNWTWRTFTASFHIKMSPNGKRLMCPFNISHMYATLTTILL